MYAPPRARDVDARAIIRLCRELHSRVDCPSDFADLMVSSFSQIFEAGLGAMGESVRDGTPVSIHVLAVHRGGHFGPGPFGPGGALPKDVALSKLIATSGVCGTATRSDLIDEETWRMTFEAQEAPEATILADGLYSVAEIPDRMGAVAGFVVLYRTIPAGRFAAADRDLLHAFMAELGPMIWRVMSARDGTANGSQGHPSPTELLDRLSPAQRSVLPYLLEGKTEAEIAKQIFRSRYTVHDHARAIYAACGVKNRVELVLLFSKHRPTLDPVIESQRSRSPAPRHSA